MKNVLLICFQVVMNTLAQLLLKKGVSLVDFGQSLQGLILAIIANIYICGGIFIFVISLLLWLYLLSQFDLSFLYPFGSLSYVLAALGGWFFFAEHISLCRGGGIMLILIGVILIAKSQ
ncbi:MAG: EamA family transporter [Holosporaceae bacterium]|jgi:drug/metabolite transporter (DMT)-like permease|nr:EamA family transporter [Holosporaceae bacterium]